MPRRPSLAEPRRSEPLGCPATAAPVVNPTDQPELQTVRRGGEGGFIYAVVMTPPALNTAMNLSDCQDLHSHSAMLSALR